jgi:hypothetical protein
MICTAVVHARLTRFATGQPTVIGAIFISTKLELRYYRFCCSEENGYEVNTITFSFVLSFPSWNHKQVYFTLDELNLKYCKDALTLARWMRNLPHYALEDSSIDSLLNTSISEKLYKDFKNLKRKGDEQTGQETKRSRTDSSSIRVYTRNGYVEPRDLIAMALKDYWPQRREKDSDPQNLSFEHILAVWRFMHC